MDGRQPADGPGRLMAGALLSTLVLATVSAFVPVTPVEPYVAVLAAAGDHPAVLVSLAAAIGQTAGKVLIFLGARTTLRSGRLRRWTARVTQRYRRPNTGRTDTGRTDTGRTDTGRTDTGRTGRFREWLRRLITLLDRPALVTPTVFLSAVTGVPPLLAVSVHAARTRISAPMFAVCCLAGRTIRFLVIMGLV